MGIVTEEWRAVAGYEGFYEVSNHGRVRSLERRARVIGNGTRPIRERERKLATNKDGYLAVALSRSCHKRLFRVHRLVAEAFIGPVPEGYQVNHIDGNKINNLPENLEYVTTHENTLHAINNGLKPKPKNMMPGECHCNAKLNDEKVRQIRVLKKRGLKDQEIANRFGVTRSAIRCVVSRQTWSHVA